MFAVSFASEEEYQQQCSSEFVPVQLVLLLHRPERTEDQHRPEAGDRCGRRVGVGFVNPRDCILVDGMLFVSIHY